MRFLGIGNSVMLSANYQNIIELNMIIVSGKDSHAKDGNGIFLVMIPVSAQYFTL